MEERENPFSGVQVKFRRSPPALKIALILLIVFCMAALIALRWVQNGIRQETQDMLQEAAALAQENELLEEKTDALDSIQSVEDIAQEELDLADPNTILFGND